MNAIAHTFAPHSTALHSGALDIRGLNKSYRIEGQPLPVLQDNYVFVLQRGRQPSSGEP